ncbi:ComEC/Rec2 family competence protein [Myroides odoratus]|uniref:ComEC/Rec2 family competence protein n=1 Tax=Myroides odoratus TaxID=256 RepID=UPI0039B06A60
MRPLKFSFLFYATALILGILAKNSCANWLVLSLFGMLLVLLCLLGRSKSDWWYRPQAFYVTAGIFYLLCFSLGFLASHSSNWQTKQHQYAEIIEDKQPYSFQYQLLEKQKRKKGWTRCVVAIERIGQTQTKGKALLFVEDHRVLQIGNHYRAIGSFTSFDPPANLGQMDYGAYMYQQNITKQVKVHQVLDLGQDQQVYTLFLQARTYLQNNIDRNTQMSFSTKSIVKALLLGDRTDIDTEVVASFQQLGVMHVLAISGLHVGIIYLFLSKLMVFIKRKYRCLLLLVVLWLFVFLSGFSPSVFRAVFMFSILAIAKEVRRKQSTLEGVGMALFLSLLFKPDWIFDVGFQLSYLAVLGIVWLMPLFKKGYTRFNFVNYFLGLLYVSFVAQYSVLALQLYYFNSLSLTFLLNNIVVVPLITLVLIGGLSFLFLQGIHMEIEKIGGIFLEVSVACIMRILRLLEALNFNVTEIYLTKEKTVALLVFQLGIGYVLYKPTLRKVYWIAGLSLAVCLVWRYSYYANRQQDAFVIAAVPTNTPLYLRYQDKQLTVYVNRLHVPWVLKDYRKSYNPSQEIITQVQDTYQIDAVNKLLVLSQEMPYYDLFPRFELLYFFDNVKVNFDRVLELHQPKQVIIGRGMSTWYKEKLKQSCRKKNIPFHDIRQKGYWSSQWI